MTDQLRDNVDRFVGLLTERGVPVNPAESAIITIPLRQRDEVSAVVLARELLDAGVFVNPVVAPAVPRGLGLIRLSLMLDHTPALLEEAAETISRQTRPTSSPKPDQPASRAKRSSHSGGRRLASWMNGEYPIALMIPALIERIGWRSGRTTSRNSTTRVSSVSFHASCS